MTEAFRRITPYLFKLNVTDSDRIGSVAVWRGGTWNSRPIRCGGVRVEDRFYSLAEIMGSSQASSPITVK